jgi:ABC-2 type transport system permease protein
MQTLLLVLTLWKYSLRGCLEYRVSFLMQAGFMILNNAIVLGIFMLFFAHFKTIGGMSFETWLPFYVFTAMVYGIVHTLFYGYEDIASRITE